MAKPQTQRRPTLGVLVGWQVYENTPHIFLQLLFQGLCAAAKDLACNLILACGHATGRIAVRPAWPVLSSESDFVPVGPWNTDGLIIVTPLVSRARSQDIQDFLAAGHPVVFIGAGEDGPAVLPDNTGGIRQAVAHLAQHGHRRIAFIAGHLADVAQGDEQERLQAYRLAVCELGLESDPRLIADGNHTLTEGRLAMQELLAAGIEFTAVLGSNDESTVGAVEVLKAAGRRIPEEVAVVGFDDHPHVVNLLPPLTTIRYPTFQIAYEAVNLVLRYINRQVDGIERVRVVTPLQIRRSCGCPPGGVKLPERPRAAFSEAESLAALGEPLASAMAATVLAQARHLKPELVSAFCQQLVEAFIFSLRQDTPTHFESALQAVLQHMETVAEEAYAWQSALSALQIELPALSEARRESGQRLLHRARIIVNESTRRQLSLHIRLQGEMSDRVGFLAAQLHAALDQEQILTILTEQLLQMGIGQAWLSFYEAEGDDPVAWSVLGRRSGQDLPAALQRFPTREAPPPGLVVQPEPFLWVRLPLRLTDQVIGCVTFEAEDWNLHAFDSYATIVRQLGTALLSARLYQEAAEARRRAEEANRLKSRFLSMVSHELRTPLNLIAGLSEMLLREPSRGELSLAGSHRQDVERIHDSARHLDGLIRDVLDLARSEVGQLRLTRELLDLAEVLTVAAKAGEQLARDKELEWRSEIPSGLPPVWGDHTRLRQVALNLISNAVKFTEKGTITLEVKRMKAEVGRMKSESELHPSSFILHPSEEWLLVSVSDTGLGIPPAEQAMIFDEFQQSGRTTARGYGGLGLGLAICKRLIELHGGTIGVHSSGDEGAGSTFYFTLPTVSRPVSLVAPMEPLPLPKQAATLLVASAGEGERLRAQLAQNKFEVSLYAADEQDEWWTQLLAAPPEAVVLDLQLASERGWEILKQLKESPTTQDIPVLFCSLGDERQLGSWLELDYLTKPVGTAELARALARQGFAASEAGAKTILVVDDDPGILEMHTRMVQAQSPSYTVLKAENGRVALAVMGQQPVDLVLLDLMMPEMDGFGVLEAMRERETMREIPVIVLTAQVLTEADMSRLNRGVAAVLEKGVFSAAETLAHVETALARSRYAGSEAQRLARKAMAYIHAHATEPISRESLASHLGVSKSYLDQCFRKEVGIAPMAYLNRYRIHRAKEMLTQTDRSVAEVAEAVGFLDANYFGRLFRQEVGMSPRAYRHQGEASGSPDT